jgi:hypothetical protein
LTDDPVKPIVGMAVFWLDDRLEVGALEKLDVSLSQSALGF